MKIIVTTGPSFEPIDEVRRFTNFSTGELGVLVAQELARAAHEVFCLRGVGATHPGPLPPCHHVPFTTNDDLFDSLTRLARTHDIGALFHVAALCDYKVTRVEDASGERPSSAKIESRAGTLTLVLEPARKVIASLRDLFPRAVLVGWKHELAGTREEALARARRQLREQHTDACVLNGRAWGSGFALCTLPDQIVEFRDKAQVAEFLPGWLAQRANPNAASS